ncbi:MAG: sugar transferase [Chloroflexota bacterium]
MTMSLGTLKPLPKLQGQSTDWQTEIVWWPVAACLAVLDAIGLALAFTVAYAVRFESALPVFQYVGERPDFYAVIGFVALPMWLGLFALYGLYDRRRLLVGFGEYNRIASACTAGVLAIIVISFLYELPNIARGWLILVWVSAIGILCVLRFISRRIISRLRQRGYLVVPTLIVGTNEEGQALADQLMRNPGAGRRIVGFVESADRPKTELVLEQPILGRVTDIGEIIRVSGAREVIIASTALRREELIEIYRQFAFEEKIDVRLSSGLFEIITTAVQVQEISGVPLMSLQRARITGMNAFLKGTLDYAGAGIGVLLLSPILALIALMLTLEGSPVLFRRRVLGRGGRHFDAFKFNSMIPDRRKRAEPIQFNDRRQRDKSEQDPRVTRVGRLIRRTSLDELPQLFNVLRGEMSIIGPRMISPDEATKYGKWQLNLLTVKPGITGPWQVRGRSAIPYEDRVRLSMDYIRNYTIWTDLEILFRTIPAVIRGDGAW